MHNIEIQTMEGKRLEWVSIYADSDAIRAIIWGNDLLSRVNPKPCLRITDGYLGRVTGAWQEHGYEEVSA